MNLPTSRLLSTLKTHLRTLSEGSAGRSRYARDANLLIINCDDFGCSRSANHAIERALRDGCATSASLMVPCPWAKPAANASRDLDIGVHLTLTSEYPAYRWSSVTGAPSLHDRDGYLPKTVREVWSRAEMEEVERECAAQIDLALEWGVDVTHLNSHMNILELERRYFDIYLRLARRYGLPLRLSEPSSLPFSYISRSTIRKAGAGVADRFFAPPWGEPVRTGLLPRMKPLTPGVTEIAFHPVEDTEELRAYDTEYADIRVDDARCVVSDDLKDWIRTSNARLIGFRPLRDAMRAQMMTHDAAAKNKMAQESTAQSDPSAPDMPEAMLPARFNQASRQ